MSDALAGVTLPAYRAKLSTTLRRWRWWRDLRRIQAEGPDNAFFRWWRWTQILRTAPVRTDPAGRGPVELHLLCRRGDYLCAIWALKTLYLTSGTRWPVVIHLQGSTSAGIIRRLRKHFPDVRLVGQREADEKVTQALSAKHPKLVQARWHSPFMMKLVDFTVFARAERIVVLDSDVLFFRAPVELRAYAETETSNGCLFQRDPASTYNITEGEAAAVLGIRMPPCVNTGICVFPRSLIDFELCETLLEHPQVRRASGWIEQTLFALCAGTRGGVKYLSSDYLISLERGVDYGPLTARHFAGPSRPLLTEEGMPYVIARGVLG
jgi:hypothetical protein